MEACEICDNPAKGQIEYMDGEVLVGCADCILEILADSYKPVSSILDYSQEQSRE